MTDRHLWGEQTRLAIGNFPISGEPIPAGLMHALGLVKAAAARANVAVGVLPAPVGDAIAVAAQSIADGMHDEQFPIDVFQTGSGTSSNMNANEVIASLVSETLGRPVHPNDEVNASQSSNDVFPTAIQVATARAVSQQLIPALADLATTLNGKAEQTRDVVTTGRTHLMDAVPITLGQEFTAHAATVLDAIGRLEDALPRLMALPIGGTAVGTGLNAPPGFGAAVVADLAFVTGLAFTEARDHVAAQSTPHCFVEVSAALRGAALTLRRIAEDLRWKASGPNAGLAEIRLPALQAGSSIMPGKVNPVICEAVLQVAAQVVGNDAAVAFATTAGNFQLTVALPVIARNVLSSVGLLTSVSQVFAERCIAGIEVDAQRCRAYAEASPAVVTALNGHLGYDEVAAIAKQAVAQGKSVRDVVVERGHVERGTLTEEQLDDALDVLRLARPS